MVVNVGGEQSTWVDVELGCRVSVRFAYRVAGTDEWPKRGCGMPLALQRAEVTHA